MNKRSPNPVTNQIADQLAEHLKQLQEKEEQIKKNESGIYNNIWYAVILFSFFSLIAIVMIKVSL